MNRLCKLHVRRAGDVLFIIFSYLVVIIKKIIIIFISFSYKTQICLSEQHYSVAFKFSYTSTLTS